MFIGGEKLGKLFGQKLHDRRNVGQDPYMTTSTIGVLAQLALELFHAAHQLPGMAQQCLPGWRRHHPTLAAQQHRGADQRLDIGDALAHG
ncbi:hypothetical protein D9M71_585290 [compost metagenome]